MKFFINIFVISVAIVCFTSCKKQESSSQSEPLPVKNIPDKPSNIGIIYSNKVDIISSGTISSSYHSTIARFSPTTLANVDYLYDGEFNNGSVDAGTVTINGITLKKNTPFGAISYIDSTSTPFNNPFNWAISGGSFTPAFTFSYNSATPNFNWTTLTDSIRITHQDITVGGISGASEIDFTVSTAVKTFSLHFSGYPISQVYFNIPANNLSGLVPGNGTLTVVAYASNTIKVNSQHYKFKTGYEIQKNIIIH
ncbi:MAG: hypothetical protein KA163_09295 [Bacteroidia bacterium]|nr:hypothetical protein [Bacteroidia bacterium]